MKYIDTSAFVKYYGSEELERGADKVIRLVDDARQGKEVLVSSIFMVGEAVSAFDRWVRIKAISERELGKISARFLKDIKELSESGALILETINPLFIMFSIDFIIKHHIPINDAIHLYTALTYKPDITEFVCSDVNLLKAARKEGLKVFNPEK